MYIYSKSMPEILDDPKLTELYFGLLHDRHQSKRLQEEWEVKQFYSKILKKTLQIGAFTLAGLILILGIKSIPFKDDVELTKFFKGYEEVQPFLTQAQNSINQRDFARAKALYEEAIRLVPDNHDWGRKYKKNLEGELSNLN
ncbi:MAG: hypothetical protein ABH849_02610 [Nanoarchaeota archaeon]